jgi:predicted membrane chloride channel (bestrophin family)
MYFLFYSAISGSFYALFKLKGSLFSKIYNKIIIISYKAYILFFNLKLYSSLSKFKSFIFIILGSIATSLLYVLRFALGLVPQLKLFNIFKPRSLNIPY